MSSYLEKDTGFVLRRYKLRETSVIATIYTRRHGKIKGVLKGFYTPKREFATSLDNFTLNEFVFYPKRRELWLVSFAELVADYPCLRRDIAKAQIAALLIQMVDKVLLLWDRNEEVFNLLRDCLQALGGEDERKVLYIFLIKFLTISGFEPKFDLCLRCHAKLRRSVYFSVSRGGLMCETCRGAVKDARILSREVTSSVLYLQSNDFERCLRLSTTPACRKGISNILREFIFYHLDFDIWRYFSG